MVKAKPAGNGGETRSSFGTISSTTMRPPLFSAAAVFRSKDTLVSRSKWCRKLVRSDVIAAAVLHFECVARNRPVSVGHAHCFGVFGRDGEDRRPVDGRDLGCRVALRDRDPEDSMAGSDVQHAKRTGGLNG